MTGDRIMFLRNERGMGMKNGTLATIERVSPEGMAVKLDDGRGVAFDTKDYAHVDHGYAATFHKSQRMTVDRAHILATPGMDRHSVYVGLSRHRDDVQLHYGRDDFADQRRLVRALSRDRGKDMAGDYPRPGQDQARAFADRREIRFPELARQVVEKVRDKARGMFDGFRPKPAAERGSPQRATPRREDQAALAEAGEDKARVMAELRALAGSAWTRADQKNRQLWFGLGGVAVGILAWAILPGLVAREVAPANWQSPERMAARTLDMPMWEGGQHMMRASSPDAFANVAAGDRIVTANRKTIEGCSKAAARARDTVRCTIKVAPAQ